MFNISFLVFPLLNSFVHYEMKRSEGQVRPFRVKRKDVKHEGRPLESLFAVGEQQLQHRYFAYSLTSLRRRTLLPWLFLELYVFTSEVSRNQKQCIVYNLCLLCVVFALP